MCFSMPVAISSMVTAGPIAFSAGKVVHEDSRPAKLIKHPRTKTRRRVIVSPFRKRERVGKPPVASRDESGLLGISRRRVCRRMLLFGMLCLWMFARILARRQRQGGTKTYRH